MKTVKILCGGYGLNIRTANGVRTKLILKGQIVELEDDEAEELIRANMAAEAVATSAAGDAPLAPGGDTPPEETALESSGGLSLDTDQLRQMTNAALSKLAEDMGLDPSRCRTKAELVELIAAVPVSVEPETEDGDGEEDEDPEDDDSVNDGEAPPDLGAEAPVV